MKIFYKIWFDYSKKIVLFSFFFKMSVIAVTAQPTIKFNALGDFELSKAGTNSHYYYNEIHQDFKDIRFGITQLNLITQIEFKNQWSLNARFLLERNLGQKLDQFKVPQLNIQWLSKKRKVGLTIGNFVNPFGSFNQQQLSIDRDFIGLPLAYSYYVNVSDKIGFMADMGDITKATIDGEVQWGSTNLYYGGYTSGAMFSWNIKPTKVIWKIALVKGASNIQKQFTDPLHFGIISRLKIQPKYFWEQGFSLSHGTFMQNSEVSDQLADLYAYSQTLIGTDFKLGYGFFEFSGEVIASSFKVPFFNNDDRMFELQDERLSSLAAYLDVKYELKVLPGSYVAYRIDQLSFSKLSSYEDQPWDNKILRHSLAFGYHFNQYLLARIAVSTQQVDNKNWDKTQGTFRFVVTAHY
jgi:hypothetical protein